MRNFLQRYWAICPVRFRQIRWQDLVKSAGLFGYCLKINLGALLKFVVPPESFSITYF